jgi:predicted O-methyltransferase YrrM
MVVEYHSQLPLLLAFQLYQVFLLSSSCAFTLQHHSFRPLALKTTACDSFQFPTCRVLGGALQRIHQDNHTAADVPLFVVLNDGSDVRDDKDQYVEPTRLGLDAIVPGAFILRNAFPIDDCEDILQFYENEVQTNSHETQTANIVVAEESAARLSNIVSKHVDLDVLFDLPNPSGKDSSRSTSDLRYSIVGVDNLWRVLSFSQSNKNTGSPAKVYTSVSPRRLSEDGTEIEWNDTQPGGNICSKFTILVSLNEDFLGGQDQFLVPEYKQEEDNEILVSIKPEAGSIMVFPQVADDDAAMQHAKQYWPLHRSALVTGGNRPKFVLRANLMVETIPNILTEDHESRLFQFDTLVRDAFLPQSPAFDKVFASQLAALYNPHMGVEHVGTLLYSLIRFTKSRKIVEIGAGYTSLWILQALKDNDAEMERISTLQDSGKCRLMDYPWTVKENVDDYMRHKSGLLCIDNCLHQRETATGAAAVAANLGLGDYLKFIQGDAYDMQFENESIDILWCDFGVGSRMRDFARGAWNSIRPGGFLVCHSTLTNKGTRDWLEDVRARRHEALTGIPPDEVVEISLLEPNKLYQNSITLLQRRRSNQSGLTFSEPLYSMFA